MYVLLGRFVFHDSFYLFSNFYYSLLVPATLFPTFLTYCHSKPRVAYSPTKLSGMIFTLGVLKLSMRKSS